MCRNPTSVFPYLHPAIDVANEILNGEKNTDYGNGEFAMLQVADTIGLSGQATAYNIMCDDFALIKFQSGSEIASIYGSLGAIFGTLTDGSRSQPCFRYTFMDAYNIKTIPANLFAGISGAPASYMFSYTFNGCRGLTSIPENLFGNISGPAQSSMFNGTFYNRTSLTGPPARINGKYLYEIWPDATCGQVGGMYKGAGLDDWDNIPDAWKKFCYD